MKKALDIKDLEPVGDPVGQFRPDVHTIRRDAYTGAVQARDTYLTTDQLAKDLHINYRQVHRWCQQWYGPLPPARRGKGMGYRLHPVMRRVARGWLQTQDPWMREAIRVSLTEIPRDWVVVVGKVATTHYTADEAMDATRRGILAGGPTLRRSPISILYVGEPKEKPR